MLPGPDPVSKADHSIIPYAPESELLAPKMLQGEEGGSIWIAGFMVPVLLVES